MKITLSALLVFLFVGCSDDATTQEKIVAEQKTPQIEQPKMVVEEALKAEEEVELVVVVAEPVIETPVAPKEEAKPEVAKKQEVKQEVKKEVAQVKQEVKKEVAEVKQEIAAIAKDPATLYKTCISCHGADAGKSALNKSQIIKGWSAQKIADALTGYKDGTYGGASKALMKGQVAKLSPEDIESLSNYIAKF